MAHESTHTYPTYMLVALIIVFLGIMLILGVLYPKTAAGATEMHTQAECAKLGQIRDHVSRMEWVGGALTDTSLLRLPPGCGYTFKFPCNATADCQQKILQSINTCWGNIKREPTSYGTCLLNLDINASLPFGSTALGKGSVCAADPNCGTTGVEIEYSAYPQQKDSISMQYGNNIITVNCMGKCK